MSQVYRIEYRTPELRDCPATAATIAACVAATAYCWFVIHSYEPFAITPEAWTSQPWRLVSPVFPHLNALHIIFNLMMFWQFGAMMETRLGTLKTALLYLFLAFTSTQTEYVFTSAKAFGLSGVVYGQFGYLWAQDRWNGRLRGLIDQNMTQTLVFWFFLCIVMTYTSIMPIANFAHGGGAIFGALAGYVAAQKKESLKYAAAAGTAALAIGLTAVGVFGRNYLHPSFHAHEQFEDAIDALQAKDYETAKNLWIEIIDADPSRYDAWFNLGITYQRLDRPDEAMVAFGRAYQLKSGEDDFRDAYLESLHHAANRAALREDWNQADACWRRYIEIQPDDPAAWTSYAATLRAAGRVKAAEFMEDQARRTRAGEPRLPLSDAPSDSNEPAASGASNESTPIPTDSSK